MLRDRVSEARLDPCDRRRDRNDALGGNPVGNIIIDHCSCSWGFDENVSMYRHMYQSPDGSKELKLPR